jgi:hypothetical protein
MGVRDAASGFWVSEPIPVDIVMGKRPSAARSPVISTVLVVCGNTAASLKSCPCRYALSPSLAK